MQPISAKDSVLRSGSPLGGRRSTDLLILGMSVVILVATGRLVTHHTGHVSMDSHLTIEIAGAILGFLATAMFAVHYTAVRTRFNLLIVLAYLACFAEDVAHLAIVHAGLADAAGLSVLESIGPAAFTDVMGRTMQAGLILLALHADGSLMPRGRGMTWGAVLLALGVAVVLSGQVFHPIIGKLTYGQRLADHLVEVVPALLLLGAFVGLVRRRIRLANDLTGWIALSSGVNCVGYLAMMLAPSPEHGLLELANICELVGYMIPLFGFSLYQVTLIAARDRAEQSLKDQLEFFQVLINAIPCPIFYKDRQGRYLGCNDLFAEFTGRSRAELVGKTVFDVLPAETAQRFCEADASLTAQPGIRDFDGVVMRAGECVREVVFRKGTFMDSGGEVAGIVGAIQDVTDYKRVEASLRESQQQLSLTLRAARMGSWRWDLITGRISCGDGLEEIYGLGRGSFEGTEEAFFGLVHPEDRSHLKRTMAMAIARQQTDGVEYRVVWPDGSVHWIAAKGQVFFDKANKPTHIVGISTDITAAKQAEEALRRSEQRYHSLVRACAQIVWSAAPDGKITDVQDWRDSTGQALEQIRGWGWLEAIHPEDRPQVMQAYRKAVATWTLYEVECRVRTNTGEYQHVLSRAVPVFDQQARLLEWVGICNDITERKRAEEKLRHAALHDGLTDLPNRAMLTEHLERAISRSREEAGYGFAVLFLDLDRFKLINDGLGHRFGDQLLVAFGQRLIECLAQEQLLAPQVEGEVGRIGGDEFLVLLHHLHDPVEAGRLATRLQERMSAPFVLDGHEMHTTISMGIVLSDRSYERAEDMIRDADTALYRAKMAGKARHVVFDKDMHERAVVRLQMEAELRKAVENRELYLVYQPIVALESGLLEGFEALVRWRHPQRGVVPPNEFIPIAEETGLIVPIGRFVLEEACRQLRCLQAQHRSDPPLSMSINLSKRQLIEDGLVEQIGRAIEANGVPPQQVHLEVTESVVMEHAEVVTPTLAKLKELGVKLAMDDFGTGHSSLSCLHRFPVDILKIDRAFVSNLGMNREYAAVVHAIVTLAHNLGMQVTAEGIETSDQLVVLQSLDCDRGQGYLFAKPLEVAALPDVMAGGQRVRCAA